MNDGHRTAIVTGANRGIGLAVATQLVGQGYRLAACVRSPSDELAALAPPDGPHGIFPLDLSDDGAITACAKQIMSFDKQPALLVNCAGMAAGGLFTMTRMADMRSLYQVNLFGPLLLSQYVANRMRRAGAGVIINIASTAGILADPGTLAYGGTKAALIHATRVMAAELGPHGIRVNAIAPAVVDTAMAAQMDADARRNLDDRSALSGGPVKPADVASLVLFLASDKAAHITGELVRLDRGLAG